MSDDIQPQDEGTKKQPKGNKGNGDRQELFSVEELAKRNNTAKDILAGVMEFADWAAGKRVSEGEFQKAINGFLNAPQGGKK